MYLIDPITTAAAERAHMPALLGVSGISASAAGRPITGGHIVCFPGTRVPAFDKMDAVSGVRAWRPPV